MKINARVIFSAFAIFLLLALMPAVSAPGESEPAPKDPFEYSECEGLLAKFKAQCFFLSSLGAVSEWLAGIAKSFVDAVFGVIEWAMLWNPVIYPPSDASLSVKLVIGIILKALIPFYAILIIFTGIYIILISESAESRAKAKNMFLKLIFSMIMVSLSPAIFQILLSVSQGVTANILDRAHNAAVTVPGKPAAGIGAFLAVSFLGATGIIAINPWFWLPGVVIVLASGLMILIRYFFVTLFAIIFPVTLFLYFTDFTKSIGNMLLHQTVLWIFIPVVQAMMVAIGVFSIINLSLVGSTLAGGIVQGMFVLAGMCGVLVAPLLLSGMMKWAGAAVAATGLMMTSKGEGLKGGITAGIGAVMMGAGASGIEGIGMEMAYITPSPFGESTASLGARVSGGLSHRASSFGRRFFTGQGWKDWAQRAFTWEGRKQTFMEGGIGRTYTAATRGATRGEGVAGMWGQTFLPEAYKTRDELLHPTKGAGEGGGGVSRSGKEAQVSPGIGSGMGVSQYDSMSGTRLFLTGEGRLPIPWELDITPRIGGFGRGLSLIEGALEKGRGVGIVTGVVKGALNIGWSLRPMSPFYPIRQIGRTLHNVAPVLLPPARYAVLFAGPLGLLVSRGTAMHVGRTMAGLGFRQIYTRTWARARLSYNASMWLATGNDGYARRWSDIITGMRSGQVGLATMGVSLERGDEWFYQAELSKVYGARPWYDPTRWMGRRVRERHRGLYDYHIRNVRLSDEEFEGVAKKKRSDLSVRSMMGKISLKDATEYLAAVRGIVRMPGESKDDFLDRLRTEYERCMHDATLHREMVQYVIACKIMDAAGVGVIERDKKTGEVTRADGGRRKRFFDEGRGRIGFDSEGVPYLRRYVQLEHGAEHALAANTEWMHRQAKWGELDINDEAVTQRIRDDLGLSPTDTITDDMREEWYMQHQDELASVYVRDSSGNIEYERDEKGNLVYKKDAEGHYVYDKDGKRIREPRMEPVPVRDEDGKPKRDRRNFALEVIENPDGRDEWWVDVETYQYLTEMMNKHYAEPEPSDPKEKIPGVGGGVDPREYSAAQVNELWGKIAGPGGFEERVSAALAGMPGARGVDLRFSDMHVVNEPNDPAPTRIEHGVAVVINTGAGYSFDDLMGPEDPVTKVRSGGYLHGLLLHELSHQMLRGSLGAYEGRGTDPNANKRLSGILCDPTPPREVTANPYFDGLDNIHADPNVQAARRQLGDEKFGRFLSENIAQAAVRTGFASASDKPAAYESVERVAGSMYAKYKARVDAGGKLTDSDIANIAQLETACRLAAGGLGATDPVEGPIHGRLTTTANNLSNLGRTESPFFYDTTLSAAQHIQENVSLKRGLT